MSPSGLRSAHTYYMLYCLYHIYYTQARAEELKRELGMMRKGTAADKYRKEAKSLKNELTRTHDELETTKASLKELEMKLASKSKTCLIS